MKRLIAGVLTMVMVLAGCGTSGETAEKAVENALSAVKAMDKDGMDKYFGENIIDGGSDEGMSATDLVQSDEVLNKMMQNFSYTIAKVDETENTATATVEITNTDIGKMMGDIIASLMQEVIANPDQELSEEAMSEKIFTMLGEYIAKTDVEVKASTVELALAKEDGAWKIAPSEELADGIMGGMLTFIKDMGAAFGA